MEDTTIKNEMQEISPEGAPGPEAASFRAEASLSGSSQSKESERPISKLKTEIVSGKKLNYYETGNKDAEFTVLNISGLGAGSGEGNLRLDQALKWGNRKFKRYADTAN